MRIIKIFTNTFRFLSAVFLLIIAAFLKRRELDPYATLAREKENERQAPEAQEAGREFMIFQRGPVKPDLS